MAVTGLRFPITASNQASKVLDAVGRDAARIAKGVGLAFAGAAAAAGGAFIKIGLDADQMRSDIVTGTGASGRALDGLMATALRVSGRTVQGMEGAGAAVAGLNTHFQATGDQLERMSIRSNDFARVIGSDTASVVDNLGQVASIWSLSADEADASLDTMTGVVQGFNIDGGKLLSLMQQFGPVFANAGLDIGQTASLFGQLHKAGVDVTRIGPGINMFLRNVAKEGGNAEAEMTAVVEAIQAASTDIEAVGVATEAFGAEGAQRLARAIRQGGISFSFAADDVAQYSGSLEKAAEDSLTLGDRFALLKNRLIEMIAPKALEFVEGLSNWLAGIVKWVEDSDVSQRIGDAFTTAGIWGAAQEVLNIGWDLMWDGVYGDVPTKANRLRDQMSTWIGNNPELFQYLDYLAGFQGSAEQQRLQENWAKFVHDPVANFCLMQDYFTTFRSDIEKKFPELAAWISDFAGEDWKLSWDELNTAVNTTEEPGGLKGKLIEFGTWIRKELPAIAVGIENIADGEWGLAWNNIGSKLGASFINGIILVLNGGISLLNRIVDGLVDVLVTALNLMIKNINLGIKGINFISPFPDIPYIPLINNDFDIPDIPHIPLIPIDFSEVDGVGGGSQSAFEVSKLLTVAPGIGGRGVSTERRTPSPTGPSGSSFLRGQGLIGLAEGGIVRRPTLAMIGEDGPEAVVPLDGRSGGVGMTVNIDMSGSIVDDDAVDRLLERLQVYARRNNGLDLSAAL